MCFRPGTGEGYIERTPVHVDRDPIVRETGDEIGKEIRPDGDASLVLNVRVDPGGDADLQVGRGKLESSLLGGDQHVAQHR